MKIGAVGHAQAKDGLMMRIAPAAVLALALGASGPSFAQHSPDPRVADLVQSGALRVGLGLGSLTTAIRNPATGESAKDRHWSWGVRSRLEWVSNLYQSNIRDPAR